MPTFWPFVSGGDARLRSAKAGMEAVEGAARGDGAGPARANVGKQVLIEVRDKERVERAARDP